jgi:thioredoxin-related protein
MQKIDYRYLIIGLCLIGYAIYSKNIIIPEIPVVMVPSVPSLPELQKNIYYDEFDKCKDLSAKYNKKLVLVFGADWCPYCKDLKKDINNITEFSKYIVCFIDTDKNPQLVKDFRVRGLPTSVIIDPKNRELSRKTGYKNKEYQEWLQSNFMEEFSWINSDGSY